MATEAATVIIGNLTGDPDLRYTPAGNPVVNFTVASTPRYFDKHAGEWRDGETLFMRCAIWGEAAENTAESLTRGTRVVVTGRLKSRSYETSAGEKRTVVELDVDEIGASLRYATAKISKVTRASAGQSSPTATVSRPATGGAAYPAAPVVDAADPWAVNTPDAAAPY